MGDKIKLHLSMPTSKNPHKPNVKQRRALLPGNYVMVKPKESLQEYYFPVLTVDHTAKTLVTFFYFCDESGDLGNGEYGDYTIIPFNCIHRIKNDFGIISNNKFISDGVIFGIKKILVHIDNFEEFYDTHGFYPGKDAKAYKNKYYLPESEYSKFIGSTPDEAATKAKNALKDAVGKYKKFLDLKTEFNNSMFYGF